MKEDPRAGRIHFVGIGGIGMSALARYFNMVREGSLKWRVSGSDAMMRDVMRELKKEGIDVTVGHRQSNVRPSTDLVVYNRAIPQDNKELAAARELDIATLPYARVLGEITKHYTTIAITGSHGKSTTTAMAGLMLMNAKRDPTILVGTKLRELAHENVRIGRGGYLVLEADDYGAAFLEYFQKISIITNIDEEHVDFYGSFANTKKAFLKFLERTARGGAIIANADDPQIALVKSRIAAIAKKRRAKLIWYSLRNPAVKKIRKAIRIAGEHNVSNAAAVYALGRYLRFSERAILDAIAAYRGAWRRMEFRGKFRGAPVFDDYAHHPTEIKATLQAFRAQYPGKAIVCVFEPHLAKRLNALYEKFTHAFEGADYLLMLPIYKVSGREGARMPHDAKSLARSVRELHPEIDVRYVSDPKRLKRVIGSLPSPLASSVIVMMGAGDIANQTKKFLD